MKAHVALLAAAVAGLSMAASTEAAQITFGPTQVQSTSPTDIINGGIGGQAFAFGAAPTVNGITFTNLGNYFGGLYGGFGTNGTSDAGYSSLQTNASYVDNNSPQTFTLSGLTPNENYQLQVFADDYRTQCCGSVRTITIAGDAGGTNGVLSYSGVGHGETSPGANDAVTAPGSGSFVIGTFTTGSAQTTQILTITGPSIQLNGVVLRDLGAAVPEPASLSLVVVAGLGLLARRRRA